METMNGHPRRWAILGVLCLSLVVIGLDNTILNVALPTLVRDLGATASQLQWMVDAYVLVFAGLLLTMGAFGDRFGRKRGLAIGLAIFGIGSIGAAYSTSPDLLIAARSVMGVGGALIMPSTLSILTDVFPAHERGRAIGAWAAVSGLGIVLGPVIGGWLLEQFWWGSVFLVNIPIVIVALALGRRLIPESKDPAATPLDLVGAVLSIMTLVTFVYAIIEAPDAGWTARSTLLLGALGVVLAVLFLLWERRTPEPMLRIEFFEDPRFSAASGAITLVFFALFGTIFMVTQYLQFVLGYTPLEAGFRSMPVATLMIAAPIAVRLVEKIGSKIVVSTGLVIVAGSLASLAALNSGSGYAPLGWALAAIGLGMGTTMAPATDSIMGSLPLAKAGVGSAMNDTTRQVGGALGVAVLGSILSSSYLASIQSAVSSLPPDAAAMASGSVGGALGVASQLGAAGAPLAQAARSAFVSGMDSAVLVGAGVALAGAIVTAVFLPATATERGTAPSMTATRPAEAAAGE